jgi:large subunit ribosomal protein L7e
MDAQRKRKVAVPENFQKKAKRVETLKAQRVKARAERKTAGQQKRQEVIKRAENYVKTHRERNAQLVAERRQARANNAYLVPAEAKILLIVRIRGINHLNPRTKRILRLFRLRQLHNASFVRVNRATLNMIKHIDPYVTYGFPDRKTIAQLLYKRGYLKINHQRIPITSNQVVEAALGKQNIISVEDLIEEILNVGGNFKVANNTIWPFKLNSPKGGFANKRHPFNQGGDWGNREKFINDLVRRMI